MSEQQTTSTRTRYNPDAGPEDSVYLPLTPEQDAIVDRFVNAVQAALRPAAYTAKVDLGRAGMPAESVADVLYEAVNGLIEEGWDD